MYFDLSIEISEPSKLISVPVVKYISNISEIDYEIENMLKTELIGVLPEEDLVFLTCGNDLPKGSDSYKGYKLLAQNIHKSLI